MSENIHQNTHLHSQIPWGDAASLAALEKALDSARLHLRRFALFTDSPLIETANTPTNNASSWPLHGVYAQAADNVVRL